MTRISVTFILALAAWAGAAQAGEVQQACLRSDQFQQIKMTGDSTAIVTDKNDKAFRVTFTSPCGARHVGEFFTTRPETMQTCLKPGSSLATNKSAACVVKSVEAVAP